ncbi:Serine/threonine-protein kinase PknD [Sporomusa silvacetica DSM 10669]|uniref:Serine/threonine-protein kinase PknD n=1 Tax=Sporomusa silvacetica DSM 10669 TaxID=1123289 RepID=A0ABZ3IR61_9FIRM|nr:AAA family ATPase [Sporomusa silvacetica]OZC20682.1 serine/threonine-protein kinase PknB [Sporomusa silvacetica DSM 10669]
MVTLPGYIITEELYEYNRFKVYRAQTIQDRSQVLVKTINPGANTADIAKLINEYEITRNLNIGGVIKPVRLERAGSTIALIMEDNGAIPLRTHLKNSPPALTLFFSIAIQLTEVLGELHQKGIIHRDLKPDAIIIHPGTEQVQIADLGRAILMSRKGDNELLPHPLTETMAYMSPEQIGRTGKAIDQCSDLYSLGVILYEILTGVLPFQADDPLQWVYVHMAKMPVNPEKINPDIPQAVSAVIMKLLAKTAMERYQSAAGLLADLAECRRQWNQNCVIEPFIPGRMDLFGCFQLSRKLYGREQEAVILTAAFERVCSGTAGLLLVDGYAGTGKTALIYQTLKPLAAKQGYFITGKFDQLQRNIPYVPFIQALGNLMQQFLTESKDRLEAWKGTLHHALGKSGAIITEVIPEVELIVGPQSPVEILQPREAQNRFRRVFRNFIRALAQKEHPLVIFLDDLQWADSASLELIQFLSEDMDSRYLLLVGAYRNNEVTGEHPLLITLAELKKTKIPLQRITLAPLSLDHTNQFVADTLHYSQAKAEPLARILYRKTGGNPFFLGQLLQTAYEEQLLSFNPQDVCWEWNSVAIQAMPLSDDIINLLLGKLQKLPTEARNVLQLAACIGNIFDLQMLTIAYEQSLVQTAADLWPSIVEEFVLPVHNTSKWSEAWYHTSKTFFRANLAARYEFLHDRVQQAAYTLIPAEDKKKLHVQIGRLLLQNTSRHELNEKVLAIMDHLNRGLNLIKAPSERIKLAGYNLLAGRKAKITTAYESALNYFKAGMELLPDNAWDEYYQLTFDLHTERSQCEYLCSHFDTAEQQFDLILSRAQTDLDKATVYVFRIVLHAGIEKYHETLQLGKQGLKLLGINLTLNPGKFELIKEILLAKWRLLTCKPENSNDLPEMTPTQKKTITLLLAQADAAAMVNPELFMLIMLKTSNLSIRYRDAQYSSMGYACYSFLAGSVLEDYKAGHQFAHVALRLIEEHDNKSAKGIAYYLIGALVSHWTEHGKTGISYLQKAVDYGLESGKLLVVRDALIMLIENKYFSGVSLPELYQECQDYYNLTQQAELLHYQLLLANLIGLVNDNLREITGYSRTIMIDHIWKIRICYLYGDYERTLALAEQAQPTINAVRGCLLAADYNFYYSLAITASYKGLQTKQQPTYWRILKKNQRQMRKWSDSCPANFLHKYLLVAAEIARLSGKDSEAALLYDQSIQSAREHGYVQNEAIAGELAARFYLTNGRDKIARVYLTDACQGYNDWGATGKVNALQNQYPFLLTGIARVDEELATTELLKNVLQHTGIDGSDPINNPELYTIRKAVEKLAAETKPEILLKSFLEIAIENAGATKGYLILEQDEKFFIEAAKEGELHPVALAMSTSLEENSKLARTIVRYVTRTLEPVVMNDLEQAGIFSTDPYLAQSLSKSIVCLPLLCSGIPVGVLYLENSLLPGVFTPDRLEVLQLLASQMAYVQKLQSFFAEDKNTGAKTALPPPPVAPLTERELEILNLIAAGMSNKEIGQVLYLTINTIKTHVLKIYEKLQVNRRMQAVTRARELKLLQNEIY